MTGQTIHMQPIGERQPRPRPPRSRQPSEIHPKYTRRPRRRRRRVEEVKR
jgi:hypothetical protein